MRKIFWITAILVCSFTAVRAQDQYNDNPPPQNSTDDTYYQDNSNYNEDQDDNSGMTYQTFYDDLSPYGTWINYPGRGYVWVPQVDASFSPYETDGHWVFTDQGWTWVSDYDWGWAPFHYGRWFNDPMYGGWCWAPGYDWAPAWVTWGEYGGYYCWAPLGWGEPLDGGYRGDRNWYFVDRAHIGDERIVNHVVSHDFVNHEVGTGTQINIINHSSTFKGSVFNAGPKREDVEKVTGHSITPVKLNTTSKPGGTKVSGGQVNIYRPAMSRSTTVQQKAIPAKLSRPEDIHPANTNNQPARNNGGDERPAPRSNPAPARQQQTAPSREESQPSRPSGGFVPNERSEPAYHASPAPSYHAPSGGGGGFHGGGGGRHR